MDTPRNMKRTAFKPRRQPLARSGRIKGASNRYGPPTCPQCWHPLCKDCIPALETQGNVLRCCACRYLTDFNYFVAPIRKRGTGLKSGAGIKVRRPSKRKTVDGDSERQIRDECDELVRKILLSQPLLTCFTCGTHGELHPGHFISRKILVLRWDIECNVKLQCNSCNQLHNENPEPYRKMLVRELGLAVVEALEAIGLRNPRLEYSDLLRIREGLRKEVERLK